MRTARNIAAGAVSGLGFVILLQQYAIAYPTRWVTILGVLAGVAIQLGIAQLVKPKPPRVEAALIETVADGGWHPSHYVPEGGLDAFAAPDATLAPASRLDGGLGVTIAGERGDWAQIVCENGWTAWADGRALQARS